MSIRLYGALSCYRGYFDLQIGNVKLPMFTTEDHLQDGDFHGSVEGGLQTGETVYKMYFHSKLEGNIGLSL